MSIDLHHGPEAPQPPRDQPDAGSGNGGGDGQQSWSFALFALLTTAAIIIVGLAAPVVFNEILNQINTLSDTADGTPNESLLAWQHLLSFQLAVVVLTLVMAEVARGSGSALGWHPPVGRMSWLQPLVVTIAVSAVTSIIAFTFFADIIARDLQPIRKMIFEAPLWLSFIALSIGAPISEELLFRGYLLHCLKQTPLGFWGGALVANTGWTLLHLEYSWLSLMDVFLAGLLFSWALWRTRSIWVPIAFHAIYNATVFFIFLIPSSKSAAPALW